MPLSTFSDDRPSGRPLGATRGRPSLRRLWLSDGPAVHAFFLRLDSETRASRFMAAVGDQTAAAYAVQAMVAPGMIVGVFVDGTLRAIGELRPFGPRQADARRVEAALTVERGFRRAGLGLKLLRRLAEAGRNRGIAELRLRCLSHNVAMRRSSRALVPRCASMTARAKGRSLSRGQRRSRSGGRASRRLSISISRWRLCPYGRFCRVQPESPVQAASSGHATMRSTSSSSANSSSLPATRPRTEMPASWTLARRPVFNGCHAGRSRPSRTRR